MKENQSQPIVAEAREKSGKSESQEPSENCELSENTALPDISESTADENAGETTLNTSPESSSTASSPRVWSQTEVDSMLADAEERGYRRGLNKQIELKMQQPAVDNETYAAEPQRRAEQLLILRRLRRSVWD